MAACLLCWGPGSAASNMAGWLHLDYVKDDRGVPLVGPLQVQSLELLKGSWMIQVLWTRRFHAVPSAIRFVHLRLNDLSTLAQHFVRLPWAEMEKTVKNLGCKNQKLFKMNVVEHALKFQRAATSQIWLSCFCTSSDRHHSILLRRHTDLARCGLDFWYQAMHIQKHTTSLHPIVCLSCKISQYEWWTGPGRAFGCWSYWGAGFAGLDKFQATWWL